MRNVLLLVVFVTFGCFGAVKTDTLKAKGNTIFISDTTKFSKKVTAPVIDVDSLGGDVKIGGSVNIGQYQTPTAPTIPSYVKLDKSYGDSMKHAKIIVYENGDFRFGFGQGQNNNGQYHTGAGGKHEFLVNDTVIMTVKRDTVKVNGALTTTTVNTDSIQINGGSYLKTYETGSFPCTLTTSYVTAQQTGTIYYQVIGSKVTLKVSTIYGTSNSSDLSISCGSMPSIIKPSATAYGIAPRLADGKGDIIYGSFFVTSGGTSIAFECPTGFGSSTHDKGLKSSPGSYVILEYLK